MTPIFLGGVQIHEVQIRPPRYAAAGMAACEPCDVGTFTNQTGRASCHPCSTGTFNNVLGAEGCDECGQGFYANETESWGGLFACIELVADS